MYQILIHALPKPENKTKFKLIFANVSEKDILLKEELDALKKKYPQTFDVVYTVDAAAPGWNGEGRDAILDRSAADAGPEGSVGYITPELIKQKIAPPSLDNKVKVFVCGEQQMTSTTFNRTFLIPSHDTGPPGQMKTISGSKLKPMDQGPLTGVLKELGYDESQASSTSSGVAMVTDRMRTGVQVLESSLRCLISLH